LWFVIPAKASSLFRPSPYDGIRRFCSSIAYCNLRGLILGEQQTLSNTKTIFVAFAIEDARSRDMLKGQSLHTDSPFEYIDMSVKEPYDSDWKNRVRTRILRSDGVIALVSKSSLSSSGQKWEIQCAKEEGKPLRGIWAYSDDRTNLAGVNTKPWTWDNIKEFINSL
jgi:hypothetical protein